MRLRLCIVAVAYAAGCLTTLFPLRRTKISRLKRKAGLAGSLPHRDALFR